MPAPRTETQAREAALRADLERYVAGMAKPPALAQAIQNLPSSAWNTAKEFAGSLAKPTLEEQAGMAQGYGTMIKGGYDWLTGQDSPERQAAGEVVQGLWEPWSTPEKATQTIVQDPVGSIAGMINPASKESRLAKVLEDVGDVAKAGKLGRIGTGGERAADAALREQMREAKAQRAMGQANRAAARFGRIGAGPTTGPAATVLRPAKTAAAAQRTLGEYGDAVLAARAEQMDVPMKKRVKPSGARYFDTSPQSYQDPAYMPEQTAIPIPRLPAAKTLTKGGRAQVFIDRKEEIAQKLAERMRGQMGTETQFFYNVGPIIKKGMELGFSREEMDAWVKDFAKGYAATSPRTVTDTNLRNSSLAMARQEAGYGPSDPINPVFNEKAGGMNDRGYPMMVGQSGIHRMLLEDVYGTPRRPGANTPYEPPPGIDYNTNTKPSVFQHNSAGNLSNVTVDTHAIRGALHALNEIEPGSIPMEYIKPKFQQLYRDDPTQLDAATWLDDTVAKQMSGVVGDMGPQRNVLMQSEYGPIADVYSRAAEILGVHPAEAQSMGWFGSGEHTGLKSEVKSIPTLLSDRLDVTQQLLSEKLGRPVSIDDVFRLLVKKKIPLASLGVGVGGAGALSQQGQQQEVV